MWLACTHPVYTATSTLLLLVSKLLQHVLQVAPGEGLMQGADIPSAPVHPRTSCSHTLHLVVRHAVQQAGAYCPGVSEAGGPHLDGRVYA